MIKIILAWLVARRAERREAEQRAYMTQRSAGFAAWRDRGGK